ncbi:hypothetical protein EPO15_00010, partial [bacterium]
MRPRLRGGDAENAGRAPEKRAAPRRRGQRGPGRAPLGLPQGRAPRRAQGRDGRRPAPALPSQAPARLPRGGVRRGEGRRLRGGAVGLGLDGPGLLPRRPGAVPRRRGHGPRLRAPGNRLAAAVRLGRPEGSPRLVKIAVLKFGGTSVADPEKIQRAAERAVEMRRAGWQVAVVVSAPGEMTDELIGLAKRVAHEPDPRELDQLKIGRA